MANTTPGPEQRYWLRYAGMGFEFFAGMLLFVAIGIWLDRRFGWSPWGTLTGAAVGFAVAMWNLVRQGLAMQRRADEQRRSREHDRSE
jgi:F0F1-type ATP synthase assembly protein I